MVGLQSTADQLELSDALGRAALPVGAELGDRNGLQDRPRDRGGTRPVRARTRFPGPSPVAAVDLEGSCWVGNRVAGSVVKIGLLENGGCVDRNGNGEITTSTDSNSDGDISGSEILDWGDDECVLVETVLVEGVEGPHVPGDDHDDYEANNLQAVAVDANGDVWAGVYDSNYLYHIDGGTGEMREEIDVAEDQTSPTAAVIAGDGTVWVSSWPDRWVLAVETSTGIKNKVDLTHASNGVAVNRNNDLFVTG